ncbi:Glycoside hydrolase, superfamily [Penicillium italicum]|uniref:Glycoside hydrolase, superfamily n=1 Tax=Penicillium italicum TaxID=40296 RepID=A0A0A2KHU1_PENIT|nr:Glycoside hydrolase, superfamily [Penicillium italicum]
MTDQEGGKVRRLAGRPVESAKQIGQAADQEAAATQMGKDTASTLEIFKSIFNLAPAVDVYREARDFADASQRSFSNPFRSAGVIASSKHFPGLGAAGAGENTDLQPVTIELTIEELRKVDMAPYTKAVAAGVDMVMTSWAISYFEIDLPLRAE